MREKHKITLAFLTIFFLAGCKDDAKSLWTSVLARCSVSDLNGESILYFGPSNNVGPGSVWRSGPEGGYRLRYDLSDMPGDKNFIRLGTSSSCNGTSSTKFGVNASAGLSSDITPASLELGNDFKKAKDIEVKAGSVSWDLVSEGPYENYINSLPAVGGVREDLSKKNRLVLYRALRVTGFSATLRFSESDAATLKGKYSGVLPKELTGSIGAELAVSWSSDNKLTLASTSEFYVAGELVPYKAGGFSSSGASPFGQPINSSTVNSIGLDTADNTQPQ